MDKVISRTISEIDKVKNENLELNDKLNIAREENERLREENEKVKWLLETKCQSEWEKENAELKEQLNKKDDLINDITNGGIQLQKECERLKKQYNCYACDTCGGKEDYINMKRHAENAIKTVHKYSQALQEIRCVVDKNISFMDTSSTTKAMIRIQAKINEVIGAE